MDVSVACDCGTTLRVSSLDEAELQEYRDKFVVTCHSAFESMIRANRDNLPQPGVPSGEIILGR